MTVSDPYPGTKVRGVRVTAKAVRMDLADGRTISAPLSWFPRLLRGTRKQRSRWEVIGGGFGVHWPDLDEDLSVEGLLRGSPSTRPRHR